MAHFLPTFWTIATSGVICGSEHPKSKFDGRKMRAVYIGHSARKTPRDSLCWYSCKKTGDFSTDFVQLATLISMNKWVSCTLWLFIVFFWSEYDFLGYRGLDWMYRDTPERYIKIGEINWKMGFVNKKTRSGPLCHAPVLQEFFCGLTGLSNEILYVFVLFLLFL